MADDNVTPLNAKPSIIDQVKGEFAKSKNEKAKAAIKKILERREEAERTIRLCDEELADVMTKHEKGIL